MEALISSPDLVFQILTDLSAEQLAIVYPSGEKITDVTQPLCPFKMNKNIVNFYGQLYIC